MTPDEIPVYERTGELIYGNTARLAFNGIMYGIHLVLFPISTVLLMKRSHSTFAVKLLLAVTTILFLSATHLFITAAVITLKSIDVTMRQHSDEPSILARRTLAGEAIMGAYIANPWSGYVNLICADAVVIWRAFVVYPHNKPVRWSLAFIFLCSTVLWIFSGVLGSKHTYSQSGNPEIDQDVNIAAVFVSLGCNLAATGCIAYKAWIIRKQNSAAFRNPRVRTQSERVLILLLESGAAYCAMQILYGVLVANETKLESGMATAVKDATDFISMFVACMAGLYPTLIIIEVARRRSILDEENYLINGSLPTSSTASTSVPRPSSGSEKGIRKDLSAIRFADAETNLGMAANSHLGSSASEGEWKKGPTLDFNRLAQETKHKHSDSSGARSDTTICA